MLPASSVQLNVSSSLGFLQATKLDYIYIALCCKLRVNHIQSVHIRTVISEFICEFCNLEHCTHLFTFTFQFVCNMIFTLLLSNV